MHAPFLLTGETVREQFDCVALIEQFGSVNGTLALARHDVSDGVRELAASRGMYFSLLDEAAYATYDRELFIDTLNDWGWFGELSKSPSWYTGRAWTV